MEVRGTTGPQRRHDPRPRARALKAAGERAARLQHLLRLAFEIRALHRGLPVGAEALRVARDEVVVVGLRLNLRPVVGVGALARGEPVRIAAGHEADDAAGGVRHVAGAAARQRADQRARHAEGRVVAAGRPEIGLRVEAAAVDEANLVLLAQLAGEVEVVAIGVQVTEAERAGHAVGVAVALVRSAGVGRDRLADVRALQDHVDDAGDRVRPIHRRGAVFQDLDALDRIERDVGDVDERALAVVADRVGRHAVAVDQHQRRADREAAQRDAARATGERTRDALRHRALPVRGDVVQHVGHAGVARLLQVVGREHLHRARCFGIGAPHVRAGHDHAFELRRRGLGLGLREGAGGGQRSAAAEGCQHAPAEQGLLRHRNSSGFFC
jgi:hypothetical protein